MRPVLCIIGIIIFAGCAQPELQDSPLMGFEVAYALDVKLSGVTPHSVEHAMTFAGPVQIMDRWGNLVQAYTLHLEHEGQVYFLDGSMRVIRIDEESGGGHVFASYADAGNLIPYGIFYRDLVADGTLAYASEHEAMNWSVTGKDTLSLGLLGRPPSSDPLGRNPGANFTYRLTYDDAPAPSKFEVSWETNFGFYEVSGERLRFEETHKLERLPAMELDVDPPAAGTASPSFPGAQLDSFHMGYSWDEFMQHAPAGSGCQTWFSGSARYDGTIRDTWHTTWSTSWIDDEGKHSSRVMYDGSYGSLDPWVVDYSVDQDRSCQGDKEMKFVRGLGDVWDMLWAIPFESGGPCGFSIAEDDGAYNNPIHARIKFAARGEERPPKLSSGYVTVALHQNSWVSMDILAHDLTRLDAGTLIGERGDPATRTGLGGPYCREPLPFGL